MRWVLPGGAILGESNHEDNDAVAVLDARTVACRPGAAVVWRTCPPKPQANEGRRWLADYERMVSTKKRPDGAPLSDEEVDVIRRQITEMRIVLTEEADK